MWTERKLDALRHYLTQYQVIFTKHPAAQKLKTVYVDAFAGTGDRDARADVQTDSLFGYDVEGREFQQGSARVALGLKNKFHHYVFIDLKARHLESLKQTVESEFPDLLSTCEFVHADANEWLRYWCAGQNWRAQRAVVFLDPYGMSVEWETIAAIAKTHSIDMWFLFPYAIGAGRMLPKESLPGKEWAMVLTKVFGTTDWVNRFYQRQPKNDLFEGQAHEITRQAGADAILEFFLERLRGVFPHVIDKPMILYNSRNTPMYALCFAAGNPKGGKTALKIAAHLARTR